MIFPHAELDAFANESDVMWRGFVASAVAAVSLQWVNPFGTAKLVLFQVRLYPHLQPIQHTHLPTGHKYKWQ
jgi:hypothetical protein